MKINFDVAVLVPLKARSSVAGSQKQIASSPAPVFKLDTMPKFWATDSSSICPHMYECTSSTSQAYSSPDLAISNEN